MSHTSSTLAADEAALAALRADIALLAPGNPRGPMVYLDSAASSLTPGRVLRAVLRYYEEARANVHRGKHALSEDASERFENARRQVASFINAEPATTIFCAGATAAMNMVVLGLRLRADDIVVTTSAEHHSVLLPLMDRCALRFVPVGIEGRVEVEALLEAVDPETRLVALTHASNVTGVLHDVPRLVAAVRARAPRARVLVDAAQSVAHVALDVEKLGADFVAFSGHKVLGPTGIGVLSGRREALDALAPELRGGGMVRIVSRDAYTLRPLPQKLEAGTPDIAGAIGLGEACAALAEIGMDRVERHGRALAERLARAILDVPGATLIGPHSGDRLPLVSAALHSTTVSPDQVAMVLSDTHKVMVRSGHFCCHPFFDGVGLAGAVRASAGPYTTAADIDAFAAAWRAVVGGLVG